jgi:hypothetical protein
VIEPWCQYSIFRSIRSILSWIEPGAEYLIEITLARIEYVKSFAVLLVNSDEPKVICLLFFTSQIGRLQTQRPHQAREVPNLPRRKVLSLEILNEPLFDFMRLVEFRGGFLNVGNRSVPL